MSHRSADDLILKDKIIQRLKTLRIKSGLSQSAFAREHGIDRQNISSWESFNNKRGLSIYTIMRFCNMVGITLSEFFDDQIFDSEESE